MAESTYSAMPDTKQKDVTASMSQLSLDKSTAKTSESKAKETVADSWEDEDISSDSDGEAQQDSTDKEPRHLPSPPPPTPSSPPRGNKTDQDRPWMTPGDPSSTYMGMRSSTTEQRRPEKTDAVARRLIAGALGLKAPKLTEEQKAYDRAIREQAKKRREEEREAERKRQEEAERAKAAIWDD